MSKLKLGRFKMFRQHSSELKAAKEVVNWVVAVNKVVIFSKTDCSYCTETKKLFAELNVPATIIELDQRDDGKDIQDALAKISKHRTVPNIFIQGKHLGGNEEAQAAAKNGKLQEMLEQSAQPDPC